MRTFVSIFVLLIFTGALAARGSHALALPPPAVNGGKPLMECLKLRQSDREFSSVTLPLPMLSNLLWAADGLNREDGRRTAPSAMNNQETVIYVFLEDGIYRYDAPAHLLTPVVAGDHRAAAGKQDFVKNAPVNLVYVADREKMQDVSGTDQDFYAAADAGFIAQNVYLFCASEGLNCVVRGWVDREQIAKLLGLGGNSRVLLGQTVGYPPASTDPGSGH